MSIGDLDAASDNVSMLLNRGIGPGDFEGDGVVDSADLGILLAAWGE